MIRKKISIKDEISLALKNVRRFIRLNALQVNPKVIISYNIEEPGCFYFDWDDRSIYINPKQTKNSSKNRKYISVGYLNSYDIKCIIYHEFGHLLDSKYDIHREYIKTESIKLNSNCASKYEEWAECFNLYMTNPYFLKIISKNINPSIFEFFKERFKSISPCSKKYFLKVYSKWNNNVKTQCRNKLGIHVKHNKIIINKKLLKDYFTV